MARKMTAAQIKTLLRINDGWRVGEITQTHDHTSLHFEHVFCTNHCMEPDKTVRCHRTIKTNTPAGSQVQSFRIHPDGSVERKL